MTACAEGLAGRQINRIPLVRASVRMSLPLRLLLLLALLCSAAAQAGPPPATEPLRLGVLPYMPTVVLFKRFGPLRDLLAKRLGRPVRLETAPSYAEFARRTAARQYDILWTAPHFALRATDSDAYQLLATWDRPVIGVVVVRADSPITSPLQLAGKPIATPPDNAMVTLAVKRHLADLGLHGDRAPRYQAKSGHMTSRFAALSGETAAAVVEINILREARAKGLPLRRLTQAPGAPGVAVLANRALTANLRDAIRHTLLTLDEHPDGHAVLAAGELPGYRRAELSELEPLRPHLGDDDPP